MSLKKNYFLRQIAIITVHLMARLKTLIQLPFDMSSAGNQGMSEWVAAHLRLFTSALKNQRL